MKSIYKESKSKNKWFNLSKTIIQTLVFWSIFLFALPYLILQIEVFLFSTSFSPMPIIGWIGFGCFGTLGMYSGFTMSWYGKGTPLPLDGTNTLVIKGPYKVVRNPMAVAGIMQAIFIGIVLGSIFTIIYALSGALIWHFFVRPSEEQDLKKRFGTEYLQYKEDVKLWLPKIKLK